MKKPLAVTLLICLLLLSLTHSAGGDNNSAPASNSPVASSDDRGAGYLPYSEPEPMGAGGLFGAIVRTIFSLAVAIALLYATLWLIKKFTGVTTGPFSESSLRIVGRIYLSPKAMVYFLRIVDQLLVIGVNAGAISLLTTIKDESRIAQIEEALRGSHATGGNLPFSRFFDKSLSKFQSGLEKGDSGFDEQLRGIDEQISRLKSMARKRRGDED
jgi:flagellar biogenesis protein FliO